MPEYPPEVMQRFHGTPQQLAAGVVGQPPATWQAIVVEDYDPAWPGRFTAERQRLVAALGGRIVKVEHVGSTAVPGLPAKPVIDIDLVLADTDDESAYLPVLTGLGFRLVLREPWWYGHRMFVSPAEDVNLHVWPEGAPEPVRHLLFRDWLRTHPDDRDLYAATKRRLAGATADRPGDYSLAKNDVIDAVYERIFAAG